MGSGQRVSYHRLKASYEGTPKARTVSPIDLRGGFRSLAFQLHDEASMSLVSFRDYRARGLGKA